MLRGESRRACVLCPTTWYVRWSMAFELRLRHRSGCFHAPSALDSCLNLISHPITIITGKVKATQCMHIPLQVILSTPCIRPEAYSTAYNTGHAPPPVYQPPEGGSKVNPTQDWAVPPPDPPQGYVYAGESSNAMHNVPLHQATASQENAAADLPHRTAKPGMMANLSPFR